MTKRSAQLVRSGGFALPVVLVTITLVAAIATAVISKDRSRTDDTLAMEHRARESLLLDAGLARGLYALLAPADPMTEPLRSEGIATWTFAARVMTISVIADSTKLDLITSDAGALGSVLENSLGPTLGHQAFSAALQLRTSAIRPMSTDQLLPFAERFSSAAARLRDVVTVFGGGTDFSGTIQTSSEQAPDTAASERPVYTIRVRLEGQRRARAMTVLIEPEKRRHIILDRVDLDVGSDNAN